MGQSIVRRFNSSSLLRLASHPRGGSVNLVPQKLFNLRQKIKHEHGKFCNHPGKRGKDTNQ